MDDAYITTGLQNGTIKKCPFCDALTELASGCNYVTCYCKRGKDQKSEFCFLCGLPKYVPILNSGGACCNDKTHNSH